MRVNSVFWHQQQLLRLATATSDGWAAEAGPERAAVHDPAESYSINDVVSVGETFYSPNESIPANTVFVIGEVGATWYEVTGPSLIIILDEFNVEEEYLNETMVLHGGVLRRANKDLGKGAFKPADWDYIKTSTCNMFAVPAFDITKPYTASEMIFHDGQIRLAKEAIPANTPWNEDLWGNARGELPPFIIESFDVNRAYPVGYPVIKDGYLRIANAKTAKGVFKEANWDHLYADQLIVAPWSSMAGYKKDQITKRAGRLFSSNTDVPAKPGGYTWQANAWTEVFSSISIVEPHSDQKAYVKDQLCFHNRKLWSCKVPIKKQVFSDIQWTLIADIGLMRGLYQGNTSYREGEIVIVNRVFYFANTDIDGDHAFIVGTEDNEWTRLMPADEFIVSEWKPNTNYAGNRMVVRQQQLFLSPEGGASSDDAFDATKWIRLTNVPATAFIENFSVKSKYKAGQCVLVAGAIWRFSADHAPGLWSTAIVDKIIDANHKEVAEFKADKKYVKFQLVSHNGALIQAKSDIAPAEFNVDQWKVVIPRSVFRGEHNEVDGYLINDVVTRNGVIKIALVASKGVWSDSDWASSHGSIDVFTTTLKHSPGKLVSHLDHVWLNHVATAEGAAWAVSNWICVGATFPQASTFKATRNYAQGDIAIVTGVASMANTWASAGPFNKTKWVKLTERSILRGRHVAADAYIKDDVVIVNKRLAFANANIPANTAFAIGETGATWTYSTRDTVEFVNNDCTAADLTLAAPGDRVIFTTNVTLLGETFKWGDYLLCMSPVAIAPVDLSKFAIHRSAS